MIRLTLTKGTCKFCQCTLGTAHTLLYGMLGIIPAAKVPPDKIVWVIVTESYQETFITRILRCVKFYGVILPTRNLAYVTLPLHGSACLVKCSSVNVPRSSVGIPMLLVFCRITEVCGIKNLSLSVGHLYIIIGNGC